MNGVLNRNRFRQENARRQNLFASDADGFELKWLDVYVCGGYVRCAWIQGIYIYINLNRSTHTHMAIQCGSFCVKSFASRRSWRRRAETKWYLTESITRNQITSFHIELFALLKCVSLISNDLYTCRLLYKVETWFICSNSFNSTHPALCLFIPIWTTKVEKKTTRGNNNTLPQSLTRFYLSLNTI